MDQKKFRLQIFSLFIVFLLLLTGCQPQAASTDEPQPAPTPEAVSTPETDQSSAISADIVLDPAVTEDADSLLVSGYLYEGLVRLDENGNSQPGIAVSWVTSDDQLNYIFEIRQNAKFSNGNPITTDIIVENFNRWFDPQSPLHGDGNYPTWSRIFLGFNGQRDTDDRAISQVDGIQKVDTNTVIIHLNRPVPELLEYLAHPAFTILDTSSLTDGYGTQNSSIVSSGAYQISSWTDTGLTLTRNPEYWGASGEPEISFIWK